MRKNLNSTQLNSTQLNSTQLNSTRLIAPICALLGVFAVVFFWAKNEYFVRDGKPSDLMGLLYPVGFGGFF